MRGSVAALAARPSVGDRARPLRRAHPLAGGLSDTETWRPARYLDVIVRRPDGQERERAQTDAEGRATLHAATGDSVVLVTHVAHGGLEAWVTTDAEGSTPHEHVIAVGASDLEIDLPDAQPFAGALHLLDTIVHGLEAEQRWREVTMPPIFAHWGRGETTDWSYFLGEVPEGSGRYGLVLMGGEPGQQASTDTDEHDEGIVLHELGHFVMAGTSGDSSIGGRHPPGSLTEPGVAWEEGRATFFAVAALASSGLSTEARYRDTIGIVPTGSCRVDQDVESPAADNPRGPGVQESVTAILWDLADGDDPGVPAGARLPDRDHDGIALGAGGVMEAMEAQWAEEGSYPGLTSFLQFLLRTGRVERAALEAMLTRTGEPATVLDATWPTELALGADVEGQVDGLSDPAPSGGGPRPENGLDSVEAYRVPVDRPGTLEVRIRVEGSGTATDHTDVLVELRDRRAVLLRSVTTRAHEARLAVPVEEGTYVVYARSVEAGSRASYTLQASLQ